MRGRGREEGEGGKKVGRKGKMVKRVEREGAERKEGRREKEGGREEG